VFVGVPSTRSVVVPLVVLVAGPGVVGADQRLPDEPSSNAPTARNASASPSGTADPDAGVRLAAEVTSGTLPVPESVATLEPRSRRLVPGATAEAESWVTRSSP
jgi:hypothetical protein